MKRILIAVAALMLAVTAACSSGSPSSSGGSGGSSGDSAAAVSAAQGEVDKASAPATFIGPSSTPPPPPGKTVAVVECAAAASGCVRGAEGVKQAAELLGWTVKVFDGQGQAAAQNTAVQQAISQGVDGIVLLAIPSANISSSMTAARSANIPVVSIEADNKVGTTGTDVFGEPDSGSKVGGKSLGAFVIADSQGKANVAVLHTTEFPSTVNRTDSFTEELKTCSTCTVSATQTYLLSSAISSVPLQVSSILQANPQVNYMFVDIGQFGALAVKSIQAARKNVKVVSVDCNPDDIQAIRTGTVQAACAANALETSGYAALDDLIRAFTNNPPSDQLVVPTKLLVKSNLPATDTWTGDFDPTQAYGKLWGKS
jgi:ribose transport system substrate-binding protein